MHINSVNYINNSSKPNFGKLNNILCKKSKAIYGNRPCGLYENRIAIELEKIAAKNDFFKDYDVNACIDIARFNGATLILSNKPAAKNIKDKIKNFFSPAKKILIRYTYPCPDDSSYYLAKRLRDIAESKDLYDMLEKGSF